MMMDRQVPDSEFSAGIRKIVTLVEEVHSEGGHVVAPPVRVAAAGAVIGNPLAGVWTDDLMQLADLYCEHLGRLLTDQALRGVGHSIEAYGKGALVGLDGEIEHGSAIIHNLRFGNCVREQVEGTALLPSAEKRGGAGTVLDLAIKHKNSLEIRSHHQTFEVRIGDAPMPKEIVVWVVLASGGRPQARLPEFGSELVTEARRDSDTSFDSKQPARAVPVPDSASA
jgi:hypothetical protein